MGSAFLVVMKFGFFCTMNVIPRKQVSFSVESHFLVQGVKSQHVRIAKGETQNENILIKL